MLISMEVLADMSYHCIWDVAYVDVRHVGQVKSCIHMSFQAASSKPTDRQVSMVRQVQSTAETETMPWSLNLDSFNVLDSCIRHLPYCLLHSSNASGACIKQAQMWLLSRVCAQPAAGACMLV